MSTQQEQFEAIETAAGYYADARAELREVLAKMEQEVRDVNALYRDQVMAALDQAVNARESLAALVKANPTLFESPKTKQFHGIKVGYRKQPGQLTCEDEAKSIELVRRKMKGVAEALITVRETLNKAAVKALDATDLASIGCSIREVDDELVVVAVDSDLDKLVDVLLAGDAASDPSLSRARDVL
jgi:uncharacterized protein YukE